MECEICGAKATKKIKIDGVLVSVCERCVRYGELVQEPAKPKPKKVEPEKIEELEKYIDPEYPEIIRKAREKMNLTIEELAKKINEKESVLSKLERGHLSPTFELAEKLERFLGIKLIKEYEEKSYTRSKAPVGTLTIGDIVEIGDLND